MSLKKDLFDFLVNLPETDTVDERQAMVLITGFSQLNIYLDWEGSTVAFFTRLLDEFGRRDKSMLVTFLSALTGTLYVSADRQATLLDLRAQVDALDEHEWKTMFGSARHSKAEPPDKEDVEQDAVTELQEMATQDFQSTSSDWDSDLTSPDESGSALSDPIDDARAVPRDVDALEAQSEADLQRAEASLAAAEALARKLGVPIDS